MHAGGVADQHGGVVVGDRILSVNERTVEGLTLEQVRPILSLFIRVFYLILHSIAVFIAT